MSRTTRTTNGRRADSTPAMNWLRERTFPDVYGHLEVKDGERRVIPSMKVSTFIDRRNRLRFTGGYDRHQYEGRFRVANYKYRDHFDRESTLYFFAHPTARYVIVMLDIDALKALGLGSPAGAVAFAGHLKTFWPNLYTEPSTGGSGVHGYLVLDRAGRTAGQVNAFLKGLEGWLRAEAAITGADIEAVEVKGSCPMIDATAGGKVNDVQFGTFAKVPRLAEERFAELAATTVLDVTKPLPAHSGPVVKAVQPKKGAGSWDGRFITDAEVAAIPAYEEFYRHLNLDLRDERYVVTPNDFAVFCVLLRWFTANPVKTGSKQNTLPVRKVQGLWTSLHEAGTADRPFNCHRFKVIRDFLSRNKHIDWIDHHYRWTAHDAQGDVETEGVACKWGLTAHFNSLLDRVSQFGGGDFVVSQEFRKGTGTHRMPTPRLTGKADATSEWIVYAVQRLDSTEFYSLAA
ncbi:MAG: hypothetical protein U0804_22195 [Gemmataceae bacterium]